MNENFQQAHYDLGDPSGRDNQELKGQTMAPASIPQTSDENDMQSGAGAGRDTLSTPAPTQTDLKSENLPLASDPVGHRVCFIGLGTSASALMCELAKSASPTDGVFYVALDMGRREAMNSTGNNLLEIHITSNQVSDFEVTGIHPTRNMENDLSDIPDESQLPGRFQNLLMGFDSVYLTGFLGRTSATSLVRVMSAVAESITIPVYGLFTTPLTLEGSARINMAESAIETISDYLTQTMVINGQDCFASLEVKPRTPSEFFPHLRTRILNFHNMVCELQAGTEFIPARLPDFEGILNAKASRHSGVPYIYSGSGSGPDGFAILLKSFKADKALQKWVDEFKPSEIFVFLHGNKALSCEHVDVLVQSVSIIFPGAQVFVGASDSLSQQSHLTDGLEDEFRMSLIALPEVSVHTTEPEPEPSSSEALQSRHAAGPYPLPPTEVPMSSFSEVSDMEYQIDSADDQHFASSGKCPETDNEPVTSLRSQPSRQPDFSDVDQDAYLPPPPDIDDEITRKIIHQKKRTGKSREAKKIAQIQQQLELAIVSRGRFEGTEESRYQGQDLDIPTYVRQGVDIR